MLGLGTILNVVAIVLGALIGVLIGNRLPEKLSRLLTDAMGLVVLVIGAMNLMALWDKDFVAAVTAAGTLLVVLASLIVGGITGSLLQIEERLEKFGGWLQKKTSKENAGQSREKFIEGFVNASLLFTIGPMAVLGALSDGLGQGIETLALKSTLDGFTAIAFAAALGWGVAFSAIPVGLWQGTLTVAAALMGALMPAAVVASITATGGILLLATGLRVLQIRMISVASLLPALVAAPLITLLVQALI
jgi:uncharacterized membrane protein YqgA involved in biofilm formation